MLEKTPRMFWIWHMPRKQGHSLHSLKTFSYPTDYLNSYKLYTYCSHFGPQLHRRVQYLSCGHVQIPHSLSQAVVHNSFIITFYFEHKFNKSANRNKIHLSQSEYKLSVCAKHVNMIQPLNPSADVTWYRSRWSHTSTTGTVLRCSNNFPCGIIQHCNKIHHGSIHFCSHFPHHRLSLSGLSHYNHGIYFPDDGSYLVDNIFNLSILQLQLL